MLTTLRHLLAVLLLPFVVTVVVPWRLLASSPVGDVALPVWLARSAGGVLLAAGLGLFGWCVGLFARVGEGTLAPWDPTRKLVAVGPYRHVRNPMISGVALVLAGETLLWGSRALGAWACAFFAINHVYFLLSEEPGLRKRFGDDYRTYAANVPRWIPRLRPWTGGRSSESTSNPLSRLPLLLALLAPPLAATTGAAQPVRGVELRWDNDIIAPRGTGAPPDHDYTQGLHLAAELERGADRRLRLGLGQRIYTPRRDAPEPVPGERPYAGWLYAAATLHVSRAGREEEFGVEAGITGPRALGEPVQNGVHRLIGSRPQQGWAHQLAFEPALALRYRTAWPLRPGGARAKPYAEAALGTLWTGAAAGASLRLGAGDAGERGLYAEAAVREEWVARNLFLDGNTFASGAHASKRPFVAQAEAAVGHRFRRWTLEYRATVRGREYRAQPKPHLYGSLALRWHGLRPPPARPSTESLP